MSGTPLAERLASAEPVRAARAALEDGEGQAWLVGGVVRDALLGRPIVDVDLAVTGDPKAAARAVAATLGGPCFPLSEDFGAWRALDSARSVTCDVSPLQGTTVAEDLAQRDFTVNAMAVELGGAELIDIHGGARDLEAGVLRVLAGAYETDPLRALRLVRLAAELGMGPDGDTERLTRAIAPRLSECSGERVFGELRRLLLAPGAIEGIRTAERLGVLGAVLPELTALRGVAQSNYHHLDVWEHTLEVLREQMDLLAGDGLESIFGEYGGRLRSQLDEPLADQLTRGQALRFGALFHDIAKPGTRAVRPDGRVTFIGHDSAGEATVATVLRRLRTSERLRSYVGALTRHHLALGFLVHERPLSRSDVYRYLDRCDPVEVEVTVLSCADRLATRGRNAERAIGAHLELAGELIGPALEWREQGPPRPPVRGDELADALGIEPGPELGELLSRLREAAYTGEAVTREQAIALARDLRS